MVHRGVVAHGEPAVVLPAKERDVVLVRFLVRRRDREPAVRDDDVHVLVTAVKRRGGQIVQP